MTKQTLQGSKRKRIAHTGFRARMKTNGGRRTIKQRRKKGRKKIGSF